MWITTEKEAFEITGFNVRDDFEDGHSELWGTKKTGKAIKLKIGTKTEMENARMDLEFALVKGDKVYNL